MGLNYLLNCYIRFDWFLTFYYTDSTIVLSWLEGNLRQFKTFVGNWIADILELTGAERWTHVNGAENPADPTSRENFPPELIDHKLWWEGPKWL